MKCLKDEYDVFQKTVNANSQFSGFISSPMSAAAQHVLQEIRDVTIFITEQYPTTEVKFIIITIHLLLPLHDVLDKSPLCNHPYLSQIMRNFD